MIFLNKSDPHRKIKMNGFWSLKRSDENFGIAKVKAKYLPLKVSYEKESIAIKEYFKTGVYEYSDLADKQQYTLGKMQTDENTRQAWNWRVYCKHVWLTEGFLNKGELDHPVNIFWSPKFDFTVNPGFYMPGESSAIADVEDGEWKLINGFGRAKFLGYFLKPEDEVSVLAFTTFGKSLEFDEIFYDEEQFEKYFGEAPRFALYPNWGTVIPLVNSSVSRKITDISTQYHTKIHTWFKNTDISSNVKLSLYNLQPSNNFHRRKIKGNVHFEVTSDLLEVDEDGKYSEEFYFNMNKICMLLPLIDANRDFFQDDKFTIKYTAY